LDYANTEVFVRDIREPEKKDDAEGSDSSQDEEETDDAGNAGVEAPA
jgi:hypothetical protein